MTRKFTIGIGIIVICIAVVIVVTREQHTARIRKARIDLEVQRNQELVNAAHENDEWSVSELEGEAKLSQYGLPTEGERIERQLRQNNHDAEYRAKEQEINSRYDEKLRELDNP